MKTDQCSLTPSNHYQWKHFSRAIQPSVSSYKVLILDGNHLDSKWTSHLKKHIYALTLNPSPKITNLHSKTQIHFFDSCCVLISNFPHFIASLCFSFCKRATAIFGLKQKSSNTQSLATYLLIKPGINVEFNYCFICSCCIISLLYLLF